MVSGLSFFTATGDSLPYGGARRYRLGSVAPYSTRGAEQPVTSTMRTRRPRPGGASGLVDGDVAVPCAHARAARAPLQLATERTEPVHW